MNHGDEKYPPGGFTVIDKRGANNPVQERETPVAQTTDNREVSERKWVSLAYLIVLNTPPNQGPLVMGRAAGLANDENVFVADYLFGARWEAGFDWTIDVKRRLDTFLTCTCSPKSGPCQFHRRVAPTGWLQEDMTRIREEGERIVPKVLEVLSKAEKTRQQAQRILAPRR